MTNVRVTPWSMSRYGNSSLTLSNGTHQSQSVPITVVNSDTNTFNGVDNPRWKDEIRLGGNATTSCSGTLHFGSPIQYDCRLYGEYMAVTRPFARTWQSFESIGAMCPVVFPTFATPSNSVIADTTNRCIRDFLQKVNDAQTNGNLTGRSIKHFEHDIHSVFNPLSAVRGKINEYLEQITKSASKYKRGSQFLYNAIRDSYLEFEFGLKPFSEDMRAILSDLSRRRFPVQRVSAIANTRFAGKSVSSNLTNGAIPLIDNFGFAQLTLNTLSVSEYGVKYTGAVRTKVNPDSGKVGWFQDNNLLPKDWLPTLYHILPYSWMVDYFTNLGDVVDSLSFIFADLTYGCKTTVNRTYSKVDASSITAKWFDPGANNSWVTQQFDMSGGSSLWGTKSFTRSPLVASDLVPQLVFHIPTRPRQYVNMLAALLPRITRIVSLLT